MKKSFIIVIIFFFIPVLIQGQAKTTRLSGKITDAVTGDPLPGAAVYIPDLKRGATSDNNGHYAIENLPAVKLLIVFRYVGYTSHTTTVNLGQETGLDIALKPTAIESREVIITGSAFATDNRQSSIPVVPVDKTQLLNAPADNLVSAIARTPGVSQITTGNGISKPVIRGLGYNRIVTYSEGIRQEGQQWGDEHGLEIDQFSADRIEILKGPGSLLYGSDALGGVVNILEPIPAEEGTISGEALAGYSTNNGLSANSLMIEGNHKGVVWRARGTYKSAAAYQTPDERIYNSAFNELSGGAMLGLNKRWGYSHLHISRWQSNIGLVEGERDSLTGKFLDIEGNTVNDEQLRSREVFLPSQTIAHTKISTVNNFILGKSQLRFIGGWQQNDRKEFEESAGEPALFFRLRTVTGDARYYFPEKNNLETVVGLSGLFQQNENQGEEYLIPDYRSGGFGAFVSAKKTFKKLTLNAGIRFDRMQIEGEELEADDEMLFEQFSTSFSALTGSAGLSYSISDRINLKLNMGRGFRSPNISELAANGVHEGTFRYEIGNPALKPETSLQFDFSIRAEAEKWDAEITLFHNRIDNFIYYRSTGNETVEVDGEEFPVYRFTQGNSVLYGFEFHSDIHLIADLHFENNASFVHAENRALKKPLPFVPPLQFENELRYEFRFSQPRMLHSIEISAGVETCLKQDRIDEFESETEGYSLINAGIGFDFKIRKQTLRLSLQGRNLSDKRYFSHLSRLKEADVPDAGRNIRLMMHFLF